MMAYLLEDQRLLHLDDPVAEYFPEFGQNGKEDVTVRQILTHRAGLPALDNVAMRLELLANPQRVLELLCEQKPFTVPGRQLAYHALTGGFVIGGLGRRVDLRRVGRLAAK